MCRFPPVADFPEFNKLLLSGANTNIFSWSGRCSDQMIPVRSHIKAQDGKRWEEGVSALEDNCIQKLSFWERHRTWCASNGLMWQINSLCSTKGWMQRWSEDLHASWEQSDNSNDLQKTQPFFLASSRREKFKHKAMGWKILGERTQKPTEKLSIPTGRKYGGCSETQNATPGAPEWHENHRETTSRDKVLEAEYKKQMGMHRQDQKD